MSFVADEIASQPDLWLRAAELAPSVGPALPARDARVAVVGCGTSLFIARSWAALRESAGAGETDAFPASEFPREREYDHVLALTRSGTTTEVVRLLEVLRNRRTPTTVVTADASLPAGTLADHAVELPFADERSVVQTRFATCTLALLRASLGESLKAAAEAARAELATPLDEALLGKRQFTFLGTGWTVGLADEAALKLRESAQAWAESYPAMEYRHGPISIAAPDTAVWIFGSAPPGLADDIVRTGATLVTAEHDPMALLVRAQRLAVALAEAAGHDPDAPRNLTRSVMLS
jgi:fructoselysine-6-P-deglycase FrlB-like protein